MELRDALHKLINRQDLTAGEMGAVMRRIMTGGASAAQMGGFLVALRAKGESVAEIAAAARVLRELATPMPVEGADLVDTCGTGGDASGTFNISTAAAFVVAAAGGRVAKHGNRSVSSRSGSADVLEAAGVNLSLTPVQAALCIERLGVGFLFAPLHHGAMQHAAQVRRELGVRTLFNLLGPLTNPARARHQLLGVYAQTLVEPFAQVLRELGAEHALVVNAEDGLDEISIASPTRVAELRGGKITTYTVTPEDFALPRAPLSALAVADARESLTVLRAVLDGHSGPARDIVRLNAGAALYAADRATSLADGVAQTAQAIDSGAARAKLDALISLSQSLAHEPRSA